MAGWAGAAARRRTVTAWERELPWAGAWRVNALVVVAVIVGAFWGGSASSYAASVLVLSCAYYVAAVGYNVVAGVTGQLIFGQAGFMAISAYLFAVLEQAGVAEVPAAVLGVLASGAAALLIGLAVIRTRHFALALVTLAFAQATVLLIQHWPASHEDDGIFATLGGSNLVYIAVVVAAVTFILADRLVRSRLGRAMAMVSSDERAAAAMGVGSGLTRTVSATIGGLFAGVGGVLLASALQFITPQNFTIQLTILLLTIIVVGGLGSMWGTVAGTVLVVLIDQVLNVSTDSQDIIYGVLLFASLALLPRGLASLPGVIARLVARGRARTGQRAT
jgi:branched-chain amino acid transport system permease protein